MSSSRNSAARVTGSSSSRIDKASPNASPSESPPSSESPTSELHPRLRIARDVDRHMTDEEVSEVTSTPVTLRAGSAVEAERAAGEEMVAAALSVRACTPDRSPDGERKGSERKDGHRKDTKPSGSNLGYRIPNVSIPNVTNEPVPGGSAATVETPPSASLSLSDVLNALTPSRVIEAARVGDVEFLPTGEFTVPGLTPLGIRREKGQESQRNVTQSRIEEGGVNSANTSIDAHDLDRLHTLVVGVVDSLPSLLKFLVDLHFGLDGGNPCSPGRIAELLNSDKIAPSFRAKLFQLLEERSTGDMNHGPKESASGRLITLEDVTILLDEAKRKLYRKNVLQ